jgi:hypothetical protein
LNKSNYDAMADLLIPRAVSYSAGLINYFFRGKIDIVPDPQNPGSHLIKNLGTELMTGKFALYYDVADGTRIPAPDANGNPLVWDSRVILADSSGVLGPNSDMPVTGFVPPTTPAPKRVGEYMLVFAGDIGEEKADAASGVVGAVAAKFIEVTAGALYIASVDANNNYVGLRVDKNGTKVLSVGDFDPLQNVVIWFDSGFGIHFSGITPLMKQVAFTQTLNGLSYQTLAFAVPPNPNNNFFATATGYLWSGTPSNAFLVSNPAPGRFGVPTWVAQSPDPAIGSFQFYFTTPAGQPSLNYRRQFVDVTGAAQVVNGQVALLSSPALTGYLNGLASPRGGRFPVSGDGLHVGEFLSSNTATVGVIDKQYYELVITLSATPTVELNLLASLQDTITETITSDSLVHISHTKSRSVIGYLNGNEQVYIGTQDLNAAGSGQPISSFPPKCTPDNVGFANYQATTVYNDQFPDGSLTHTTTCDEVAGPQFVSGQALFRALTQHASDAVYFLPSSSDAYYRGMGLASANFLPPVTEVSPLGEVFVARGDLSFYVHKPLPGGMPQVVFPPNVVRVVAALWL